MNWKEYLTLGQTLTPHDLVAVIFFLVAWLGYARFAVWYGHRAPSLHGVLDGLRRTWALRMVERDNRMVDVNIVRNLTRSSQFFASTTLLILGALIALLGYVQRAVDVVAELLPLLPRRHHCGQLGVALVQPLREPLVGVDRGVGETGLQLTVLRDQTLDRLEHRASSLIRVVEPPS